MRDDAKASFAESTRATGRRLSVGRGQHGRVRWFFAPGIALVAALVLASTASAEEGIRGYFDASMPITPPSPAYAGNAFGGPIGVAPTDSNGPLPNAGDFYVSGFANCSFACPGGSAYGGYLQQVSADGTTKRIWGHDAVFAGGSPDNSDETQAVRISATGGTFTINFQGDTTAPIAFDATTATVESQLNGLGTISDGGGSVTVSGGPGDGGGNNPYLITFNGGPLGGADQPLASADGSALAGPGASATVYTTNPGNTGFEICEVGVDVCNYPVDSSDTMNSAHAGTVPGALGEAPRSLAVNQVSGEVYVRSSLNRINRYSPNGQFISSFGRDVVRQGPDDSNVDATQELTVNAASGTYTLSLFTLGQGSQTTTPIPFDAAPSVVEAAINNLPVMGDTDGSVNVSGADGGPYTITFNGGTAGGDVWLQLSPSPSAAATVKTLQEGGANEVCTPKDACKLGAFGTSTDGSVVGSGTGLAIAPAGAPNAGDVLTTGGDGVSEFTADGEFIRSFGWDVVKSGPSEVAAPNEQQDVTVKATGGTFTLTFKFQTTAPIAFNAPASGPGSVEAALNALPSIGGLDPPASVSVTGGPGDLTGSSPYQVTFGGSLAGDDVSQISANGFSLTSSGTPSATVTTTVNGGAFEVCKPATGDVCDSGTEGKGAGQFSSNGPDSVAEDESGAIYTVESNGNHRVQKFTPAGGLDLTPSIFGFNEQQSLTVNASAGQFKLSAVSPSGSISTTGDLSATATAADVQTALNGLSPISTGGGSVTVSGGPGDAGGNNPYTITFDGGPLAGTDFATLRTSQGSTPLSGGTGGGANQASVTTLSDGGPGGRTDQDNPLSVDVLPSGNAFVAKEFPNLAATCRDGFPLQYSLDETRIQEVSPDGSTLVSSSVPCAIDPSYFDGASPHTVVSVGDRMKIDPGTGEAYVVDNRSPPRVDIYGEVGTDPEIALNPVSDIAASGVTLSGTIDPNGPGVINHPNPSVVRYAVEFRKVGDPDWSHFVAHVPSGSGSSPVPFSVGLSGLEPKTDYEARVIAIKPFGFTPVIETTPPFTTLAGKPKVESPFSDNVTAHSADLHALINPSGADTSYHVEYGTTINYGNSTPVTDVGDGAILVPIQVHIDGLDPVVYHFRVIATNSEGTTVSPDQTFNFYPETCPNSAARQQTGATRLPDCRAYELVVPGKMGTISLEASGPTSAYATNPPRFAFQGLLGVLPGPWNPPNAFSDTYVATRTDTGWETHYVGVQVNELGDGSGNPGGGSLSLVGDLGLDSFLQWSLNAAQTGTSAAPYLFDAEGNQLGRLPTNLADIPGADDPVDYSNPSNPGWVGDELLSGDGRHFFYSSAKVALAPGGVTTGAGSVYHNDIANKTVDIVSKTEAGTDIPQAPGPGNTGHFIRVLGASPNGSHVLMDAPAGCTESSLLTPCPISPGILYMRVNDTTSYDVSEDRPVKYEGMTTDGSKVFFTTAEQMPGTGDTDNSIDLYMWSEADDSLTRISTGNDPVGNTDGCISDWISACGVQVVKGSVDTDNAVASDNAAVYFYSPEQLVGSEGFPGRRNLYVYRDGELHFIAALDVDKPASRFQVSANGRFAAFITRSRLTNYDNEATNGICSKDSFGGTTGPQCLEMYLYDAQTEDLVCASCEPSGAPPSYDVEGSTNGIFMTDDGRAFFSTKDALVPSDTDGLADVYEYVQSRPQLITTGSGSLGGDQAYGPTANPGLVGVSADGTDVYFATLETLVSQDENGATLKFYDARINGGFPVQASVQPCAAADECHGPGNATPAAPGISSAADLGAGGNVSSQPKKHKKRRHHHKRHHRHHARSGGHVVRHR